MDSICTQCHRPVPPSKHKASGIHDFSLLSLLCLHKSKRRPLDDSWQCQCDIPGHGGYSNHGMLSSPVEEAESLPFVRLISSIPNEQLSTRGPLEAPTQPARSVVQVSSASIKPKRPPRPPTNPTQPLSPLTLNAFANGSQNTIFENPSSNLFAPSAYPKRTSISIRSNKSVHFEDPASDCFSTGRRTPTAGSGQSTCSFSGSLIEETSTVHQRRAPHYMVTRASRPMTDYSWSGPGNVVTLGGANGLERKRSHYTLRSETGSMVSFWDDTDENEKTVRRKLRRKSRSVIGSRSGTGRSER